MPQVRIPRDTGHMWLQVVGSQEGRLRVRLPEGGHELISLHLELQPWMQAKPQPPTLAPV